MKLTLENIGKIKHAEIDLSKDLIVLCGPNNTGKTYVAYSVYGLSRMNQLGFQLFRGVKFEFYQMGTTNDRYKDIEIDLERIYKEALSIVPFNLAKELPYFLPVLFASSTEQFELATFNLDYDPETIYDQFFKSVIDQTIEFHDEERIFIEKPANTSIVRVSIISKIAPSTESQLRRSKINVVGLVVFPSIIRFLFPKAEIAPAERIAINIFSKELSEKRTKLVDELLDAKVGSDALEFVKLRATRFSLPIRESLANAERMDVIQRAIGPYSYLADDIENEILQGFVRVSEYGEVRFRPKNSEQDLGIHLAGSVVKSLASIVFYLRHIAESGDFYIIDEPELTLHPDNQRKMARVLARMMNAGIKVMMSTHSDYIIRELNNLMMLKTHRNPEKVAELMEKYGYKEEELLDHNRVGAYLFTEDVTPLEVNETGFEVKTIDDQIHQLNESSMDIFLALHD